MTKAEEFMTKSNPSHPEKSVYTRNSTDALALVEHGSELVLNITAPTGNKFVCRTAFIGIHSDNYILAEIPAMSDDDFKYFFQAGFWTNVRAISPRGEGAMIHFRSQLLHVLHNPLPMAIFSIPDTMQMTQLRKEPRYDVLLFGTVNIDERSVDCEIRDISKGGCRFFTRPAEHPFTEDDTVSITVFTDESRCQSVRSLKGKICNLQHSVHYARYGLEYTDRGKEAARQLLNQLRFNGIQLAL